MPLEFDNSYSLESTVCVCVESSIYICDTCTVFLDKLHGKVLARGSVLEARLEFTWSMEFSGCGFYANFSGGLLVIYTKLV